MNWVLPGEQDTAQCIPHCSPCLPCGPKWPRPANFPFYVHKNGNNNVKPTTQCLGSTPPQPPVHCLTPERAKSQTPPRILLVSDGAGDFDVAMTLAKFFLFFCGVVKTRENGSQHLAITFSGRKKKNYCCLQCMVRKKPSRLICECDTDPEQFLWSGKADKASLAL